ncbi:hypothetical protein SDC9_171578 [bioreactor metagenome]|uniref:Uncharacterized protein n=1 Tax=bioreactor metagenome TaxID=1076179 RepID=A0A645GJS2_9ZZZZ
MQRMRHRGQRHQQYREQHQQRGTGALADAAIIAFRHGGGRNLQCKAADQRAKQNHPHLRECARHQQHQHGRANRHTGTQPVGAQRAGHAHHGLRHHSHRHHLQPVHHARLRQRRPLSHAQRQ